MRIDSKDASILNLVQLNNKLTAEEIGKVVGLSYTAVIRRLKRLRDHSIIVADIALVSPEATGFPVRVHVSCSIERNPSDTYDRFMDALRTDPMVISADVVIGKPDFVFTVVSRDMESFAALVRRYTDAFPSLTSLTSLAVLQAVKRGSALSVEPSV